MSKDGKDDTAPPSIGLAVYDAAATLVMAQGVARLASVDAALSDPAWQAEIRRRRLATLTIDRSLSLLAVRLPLRDGALIVLSESPTDAVFEFVAAVDFAWDILHHLITDPFDAMTVVDAGARVAFISPVHERFFGLGRGEAIGRSVSDVIENTRLHDVIRTGQPEIGDVQRMKGAERVVSRVPIHRNGRLVGAVGRVMFKGPAQVDALRRRVGTLERQVAFHRRRAQAMSGTGGMLEEMIGQSPPMLRLRAEIATVAPLDVSVLISGDTGTGKELVARALHGLSPRASAPLVTVNAAALPASLVESELFGYEAGAFTGADRKGRRGRFEQAEGGSIFLDEIGDMPLETQAKLLRVLQDRTVERVGGEAPVPVDFRLICATNRDLAELVARRQFRLDLYYRISSVVLRLPLLVDRGEDILLLARHVLTEFARRHGRDECALDASAEAHLLSVPWPGNVRQLRHAVERAAIFARGPIISGAQLAEAMALTAATDQSAGRPAPATAKRQRVDHPAVLDALRRSGGNKRQAAAHLGISRSHLYNILAANTG